MKRHIFTCLFVVFASAFSALVGATEDVTDLYLANASLRTSATGWSGSSPTVRNNCAEFYETLFDVYQTLTVPNGVYRVKITGFQRIGVNDAGAAYAAGSEMQTAYLYANEESASLLSLYSVEAYSYGVAGLNGYANSMSDAEIMFDAGEYVANEVTVAVTDGKLRVGVRMESVANYYWVCFRDLQLFGEEGDELTVLAAALEEKKQEAIGRQSRPMQQTVSAELAQAVTAADAALALRTAEVMNKAMEDIKAAMARAEISVAIYEKILQILTDCKGFYMAGTMGDAVFLKTADAVQEAYTNRSADSIALVNIGEAVHTYFEQNRINNLIVNADMEAGTDGWDTNMSTIATGESYAGFGGTFQERWVGNGNHLGDFYSKQELTGLPDGEYLFSAYCIATQQGMPGEEAKSSVQGVYLTANGRRTAVATLNEKPERFFVKVTVIGGMLTIGFETEDCTANWVAFDNAALYSFDPDVIWECKRGEASVFAPLDITRFIDNPSFESDGKALTKSMPAGWMSTGATESCAWYGVNAANGNDDRPTEGNYLFGLWDAGVQSAGITQQLSGLPAGYYRLTADMLASHRDNGTLRIGKQCLFARNDSAYFRDQCTAQYGDVADMQTLVLRFQVEEGTSAFSIGVSTAEAPNETWFKVDHFTLVYLGTSHLSGYEVQFVNDVKAAHKLLNTYPYVFGAPRAQLEHCMGTDVSAFTAAEEFLALLDTFSSALQGYTTSVVQGYGRLYTAIETYAWVEDLDDEVAAATEVLVSATATLEEVLTACDVLLQAAELYKSGRLHLDEYLSRLQELTNSAEALIGQKMQSAVSIRLTLMTAQCRELLDAGDNTRMVVEEKTDALQRLMDEGMASVTAYNVLRSAIEEADRVYRLYGSKPSAFSAELESASLLYDEAQAESGTVYAAVEALAWEQKIYVKQQLAGEKQITAVSVEVQGGSVLRIVSDKQRTAVVYRLNGNMERTLRLPCGETTVEGLPCGTYIVLGKKVVINR